MMTCNSIQRTIVSLESFRSFWPVFSSWGRSAASSDSIVVSVLSLFPVLVLVLWSVVISSIWVFSVSVAMKLWRETRRSQSWRGTWRRVVSVFSVSVPAFPVLMVLWSVIASWVFSVLMLVLWSVITSWVFPVSASMKMWRETGWWQSWRRTWRRVESAKEKETKETLSATLIKFCSFCRRRRERRIKKRLGKGIERSDESLDHRIEEGWWSITTRKRGTQRKTQRKDDGVRKESSQVSKNGWVKNGWSFEWRDWRKDDVDEDARSIKEQFWENDCKIHVYVSLQHYNIQIYWREKVLLIWVNLVGQNDWWWF